MSNPIKFTIYGRDQICASCVGAPSSKETYEWLQAAIGRKYGEAEFQYEYVDMDEEQDEDKHQQMIEQMEEEDYLYPLVLLNEDIVAEGITQLKPIYKAIEKENPSLTS